jgi:hypothetical protein
MDRLSVGLVRRTGSLALGAVLAFGGAGCLETGEDDGLEPPPEGNVNFIPDPDPYPTGDYGLENGQVMKNVIFETGLVNALANPDAATTEISLADFYNPTGKGVYAEGSPFPVGEAKPRALLIAMAARWCQPCRVEAKETLPDKYAELGPKGAEFLLVLADGAEAGIRATEKDLRTWTNSFETAYPSVIDEDSDLAVHFSAESYPANMIIDTTSMKIVRKVIGAPEKDSAFWKQLASLVED